MSQSSKSTLVTPLLSGLAGAIVLIVIYETARRILDDALRVDTLGRRSIARGPEAVGIEPPHDELQALAFAGDLVSKRPKALTCAWYLADGLAAGAVFRGLARAERRLGIVKGERSG